MDDRYWQIHKAVYLQLLNEVDKDIADLIVSYPYGDEAVEFNDKVKLEVERQVKLEQQKNYIEILPLDD